MKEKLIYQAPDLEQVEVRMESHFLASQEAMYSIAGTDWDDDVD